jgi:hypothetical protein
MTTPINLAQLRHDITLARDARYPPDISHAQVLALIDTAEAAIALFDEETDTYLGDPYGLTEELTRLRETLNPYTTNP